MNSRFLPRARSRSIAAPLLSLLVPIFTGACEGFPENTGAGRSAETLGGGHQVGSPPLQADVPVPPDTIVSDTVSTRGPIGSASLSVSDLGDARYHIPIWVPPGRSGIQPDLALDYSSNSENGYFGMGWNLSGLPRITRCRKHGEPPITWGNPLQTDEFCLDGEFLVSTGPSMTTFHPLRDDFSLITAQNRDPLGPGTFEQRTKDGRILTFGGPGATMSGSVDGQYAPGVFGWPVTRIQDRAGNFLTVSYVANGSADLLPVEIDYTGSASDPSTQRSVKFLYEDRPDVDDFYVSGMEFKRPQRLARLEMYAPSAVGKALVRSIDLHYTQSPTTGRSLLHELDECAVDAAAAAGGSPSATSCRSQFFTYTAGDLGFDDIDTKITDVDASRLAVLDIDGDGRQDILYAGSGGVYHFRLSNGAGFDADQATPIHVQSADAAITQPLYWPRPADIDGDGHTDIFVAATPPNFVGDPPGYAAYRAIPSSATPGGWNFDPTPMWSGSPDSFYDIADLNGDHYPDLLKSPANPHPTQACSNYGACPSGSVPQSVPVTVCDGEVACSLCGGTVCIGGWGVCCDSWPGPVDVQALFNSGGTLPADSAAQSFASRPPDLNPWWTHLLADDNGDGRPDLLMPTWPATPGATGTYSDTQYNDWGPSSGMTTLPAVQASCSTCPPQVLHPYFADMNGDGLADVIYGFDANGSPYGTHASLLINTGRGFLGPADVPVINVSEASGVPTHKIDWNLDGKADVIQHYYYSAAPPGAPGGQAPLSFMPSFSVFYNQGNGTIARADLPPNGIFNDGSPANTFDVLDVDGDGLDDLVVLMKGSLHVFRHRGGKPDLLTLAFGAQGRSVGVTYKPFVGPDASADCKVPVHCVTGQMWVPDTVTVDNGLGGSNAYQHSFQGGRVDLAQWGMLGFKSHATRDLQTQGTTTRTLDLSAWSSGSTTLYPYAGRPAGEVTTVLDPQSGIMRTVTKSWTYFVKPQPYGSFAVLPATMNDLVTDTVSGGTVVTVSHYLANVSAATEYDDYGNVLSFSEVWPLDGLSQTTEFSYQNRPDTWLVSLPRRKSVMQLVGFQGAVRETGYEFDGNGQLFRRTDNPGADNGASFDRLAPQSDGVQTLYTQFDRNPNGLVETVTVSDGVNPGLNRVSTTRYDAAEGMFPVLSVDALGHAVNTAYEPGLGVLAVRVDENGLSTTNQYDAWGRPRAEHPPTGDDRTITYLPASSAMPFGGTENSRAGGADVVVMLDPLGREAQTATTGRADGKTVYVTTGYDTFGRVHSKTRPYFAGGAVSATTTDHDVLGRVVRVTYPDGSQESTSYVGVTRTTVDPTGNQKTVVVDTRGRPVTTFEYVRPRIGRRPPRVTTTTRAYGPFDTLVYVADTAGNVVRTVFDRLGRPRIKLDPDAGGAREYLYSAFGELTDDVRGGAWDGTTFTGGQDEVSVYDALGRVVAQIGTETRAFVWDTAANGIGKLGQATFDGTLLTFTYDSASRLATKSWDVGDGVPVTVGYAYDANNRLDTITYPTLSLPAGVPPVGPLVVQNHYSAGGQLTGVTDATTGTPYWTLEASDPSDTFPREMLGDGVETTWSEDPAHPGWLASIVSTEGSATVQSLTYHHDGHGRLRGRDDAVDGTTETFDYDGVDRLTQWTWNHAGATRALGYTYDDLGDLQAKIVQVGTGSNVTYAYDKTHFGPHQPCAMNAPSCPATGSAFAYDGHGNQTAAPGRTISYNDFDLPSAVTTAAGTYTFQYDALLHRLSRRSPDGRATFSFEDLYERRTDADGTTHHVFTISAHHPVAEIDTQVSDGAAPSQTTTYLLVDHQGTIDTLVDAGGNVTHAKYEPFGARVEVSDPSQPGAPMPGGVNAGFTGDAHDDDLGLIDMRGRVYDPAQQRFLSEDPIAPNPTKGQALDPYAYVFNNPMNWTDPSGFEGEGGGGEGEGGGGADPGGDGNGGGEGAGSGDPGSGSGSDPVAGQNQDGTQGFDGQSGPYSADSHTWGDWQSGLASAECVKDGGCQQDIDAANHGHDLGNYGSQLKIDPAYLGPALPPTGKEDSFAMRLDPLREVLGPAPERNELYLWANAVLNWTPDGSYRQPTPSDIAMFTELTWFNINFGTCADAAKINAFLLTANGYGGVWTPVLSNDKDAHAFAAFGFQPYMGSNPDLGPVSPVYFFLSWGEVFSSTAAIDGRANWPPGSAPRYMYDGTSKYGSPWLPAGSSNDLMEPDW